MKKLNTKWKIFIYSISGLGINMLNLVIGSYLVDALMTEGFNADVEKWTYLNITLVSAVVWSVLVTVAKIVDGIIDIPVAGITDNLKCRFGRRRPVILIGLIPLIIVFCLFLVPLTKSESMANTIWFGVLLCLFYIFYTAVMTTYYATFSEIVEDEKDKMLLSNYKSAWDIVYFVMGYALIPLFIGFGLNIRIIALIFLPLSLTMLIPLFMIKEKSTRLCDIEKDEENSDNSKEEKKEMKQVNTIDSLKLIFKNKSFLLWLIIFACLQFGLQMFIAGQNVYYSGTLNLSGFRITVLMACAFAPVPFTLILYNKITKRFGFKVGYVYSLLAFILAMIIMFISSKIEGETLRLVVAAIGSVCAAFGLGTFFSVGYSIPSILADREYKETGVSHSAMFFAIQGLASGIASAIATGVVWINLKNSGLTWTMPIFVSGMCAVSLILAFLLPHNLNKFGLDSSIQQLESSSDEVKEDLKEDSNN